MLKNLFIICFLLICLDATCQHSSKNQRSNRQTSNKKLQKIEKPKYMWFDATANFKRFLSKDSILYYLDKTKAHGFNQIVVDVRPGNGDVLYKSSFMTPLTKVGNSVRTEDWDYLQFFIDAARERGLKVSVSVNIFPAGSPHSKAGLVYRNEEWAKKAVTLYTPHGMVNIKDDPTKVAAFLNPVLPEVQEYCMKFVREIVQKYDFDALVLDYCRYSGVESDFSEASKVAFEQYTGSKVDNFPEDILVWKKAGDSYYHEMGPYGKQWFEFRSMVIHDFVKRTKEEVKALKPDMKLEYWTASWYGGLYLQGQNWASKRYDPTTDYTWATPNYKNTGFAEHLDVFMCGTYLEVVYGKDKPVSIEAGLANAKRLIMGDNTMVASLYANNYKDIADATYVGLTESEGLVMFDIIQVIEYNLWDQIKQSIDKAEKEMRNEE